MSQLLPRPNVKPGYADWLKALSTPGAALCTAKVPAGSAPSAACVCNVLVLSKNDAVKLPKLVPTSPPTWLPAANTAPLAQLCKIAPPLNPTSPPALSVFAVTDPVAYA